VKDMRPLINNNLPILNNYICNLMFRLSLVSELGSLATPARFAVEMLFFFSIFLVGLCQRGSGDYWDRGSREDRPTPPSWGLGHL